MNGCACGCGAEVAPGKRFIRGHNRRGLVDWLEPNPSGVCQCGCGQPTPPAKQTSKREGSIKGRPTRYLPGHQRIAQWDAGL